MVFCNKSGDCWSSFWWDAFSIAVFIVQAVEKVTIGQIFSLGFHWLEARHLPKLSSAMAGKFCHRIVGNSLDPTKKKKKKEW